MKIAATEKKMREIKALVVERLRESLETKKIQQGGGEDEERGEEKNYDATNNTRGRKLTEYTTAP